MKYTLRVVIALCLTAIVVVVACKKKSNNYNGPTQSLNQMFSGLRTTPQNLSVTAGRDTIVFGADSTVLHFYANSFKDANGKIITSGTIYIQLLEMYKPGDMIANRTTTLANGQLLQSGGEVEIIATMNGQIVFANKYGIGFKQLSASTTQMELYYGGVGSKDSLITWTEGNNTTPGTTSSGTINDSDYYNRGGIILPPNRPYHFPGFSYIFDSCTNFNFVNCDLLQGYNNYTTLSIVVPDDSYTPSNTEFYLALSNINDRDPSIIVVLTSTDAGNGGTFYNASTNTLQLQNEGQINIVPVGKSYKLVVITNKNGGYTYYQTSGVTTSSDMILAVTPTTETLGDIIARLAGL